MQKKLLLFTLAGFVLTGMAFAAPAQQSPPPAQTPAASADVFPQKCPVTGKDIASAQDSAGTSVYKGKTYYFCCVRCKGQFDDDPAQYVKPDAPAPKPAPAK